MRETSITILHEDDLTMVDTTVKGMASALRRAGFQEMTRPENHPYRRFQGEADQIRFRLPKGQRRAKGAAAKNALEIPHGGENAPGIGHPHMSSREADLASNFGPGNDHGGENEGRFLAPPRQSRTGSD